MSDSRLHLVWYAGGIILSLMVYSVLQERIMTKPYGKDGEVFSYSLFLVLSNRLTTCTVSIISLLWTRQDWRPAVPLHSYAAVSLSNVVATTCQYEALKYVTFPLQTLGKCAKMMPVMLWSGLIMGKRYKGRDYVLAVIITAGVLMFFLTGPVSSKPMERTGWAVAWGGALMFGYLGFDGFTSTFQDMLFKGYNMSVYNQMLYVNAFSSLVSLCGLISIGQLGPATDFIARHPEALLSILVLSLSATLGQSFIMHTIRRFGALLFAGIMTTRQFLSILVSSAVFGNPLSAGQWAGTALVFVALYFKSLSTAKAKRSEDSEGRAARQSDGAAAQPAREPLLPASSRVSPRPNKKPVPPAPWDVEASAQHDSIPALRKE